MVPAGGICARLGTCCSLSWKMSFYESAAELHMNLIVLINYRKISLILKYVNLEVQLA